MARKTNTAKHRLKSKVDMTTGNIMKLILLFALPICAGNVLQQLYNTVDTIVIGNFCDSVALAAVGTSSQPVEMLLCIFLGIGTGVSILVSQYTGSGDDESLRLTVETATSFVYLCGFLVTILGLFIGPLVLRFMQVPDDTMPLACSYLNIIFLGTLGNLGYNLNAGILRGLGDSSASLIFLFISCIVNIVLDLLFVAVFGLGVSGAALATTIAMFSSWFFSIWYIKTRYAALNMPILPKRMNKEKLAKIISIGLPLGLNHSIYSVGHILMQSMINAQGSTFIAGCSVATKVLGIANVAIASFSSAATTFSGQNIGANNYRRLKNGAWQIPLFSGIVTLSAGLLVTACRIPILKIFTQDAAILEVSARYVSIVLPFSWCYAVFNCIICFANGLGVVKFPTIVNILMLWAVRIPSAHLIGRFIDGGYIMACFPISFAFGMFCMFTFFLSKTWKEILMKANTLNEAVYSSYSS